MGKVNGLWMDEHDAESHDVTGMSAAEARAENAAEVEATIWSTAGLSKHHMFNSLSVLPGFDYCQKCLKSVMDIVRDSGSTNLSDCEGPPKIEPMVKVMLVRVR